MVQYADGARQNFLADGRPLHEAGAGESWGKWWAKAGTSCSTWPPSETPSCHEVARPGREIRFTGTGGDETIGLYIDLT